MHLLKSLEAEHRLIDGVTRALEAFVPTIDGRPENLHELIRFMTFLRGYVDGYHHEREETVLIPALVAAGFNANVGPVAYLREQHREEGRLLLRFETAACARMPWEAPTIHAIVEAALALIAFSRGHMEKEQTMLFPVAERDLQAPAAAAELERRGLRFENRRAARWDVPWLEQLGEDLAVAHGGGPLASITSTLPL
jgi:hemerythrin-like domain-containing protein